MPENGPGGTGRGEPSIAAASTGAASTGAASTGGTGAASVWPETCSLAREIFPAMRVARHCVPTYAVAGPGSRGTPHTQPPVSVQPSGHVPSQLV